MGETEDFIGHIKTIVNSFIISDSPMPTGDHFKVVNYHDNRFVIIPRTVVKNYRAALTILKKKASAASRQISDEQLDGMLIELLKKLHVGGKVSLTNLSSDIRELFNSVKRFAFNDYSIFVPISNLGLGIDGIEVGHVEFFRMTHALAQRISLQPDIIKMIGSTGNNKDDILHAMQKFFDVDCLSIVKVQANDDQKAIQIAMQKIEQSLNVLRFYRIDSAASIKGDGSDRESKRIIIWNSTLRKVGATIDSSRLVYPRVVITQDIWDDRKRLGLADIHNVLLEPENQLTKLEQDILSAIYWIGKSLADSSKADELVKIMLAFDLLLAQDVRNKKDTIARRFASIVYAKSSKDTVLQVYDHVKKLYSIRNNIMHAGEKYVDKDSAAAARVYATMLVVLLLKNAKAYPTILDLIDKKFPMRDDALPPMEEKEN